MKNKHSIGKIKIAYKNGIKIGLPFSEIEKFGFKIGSHWEYNEFKKYLNTLNAHRRQAVMRIGRAALKRGTLVDTHHFWTRLGVQKKDRDFREIPFLIDTERKGISNDFDKAVRKAVKHFTKQELIMVIESHYGKI